MTSLSNRASRRNFPLRVQEHRTAIRIGSQDHALALVAPQLPGLQVYQHWHFLAYQLCRIIHYLGDTRHDLPLLIPKVENKPDKFTGLRNPLGRNNFPDPDFQFFEIVKCNHICNHLPPSLDGPATKGVESFDTDISIFKTYLQMQDKKTVFIGILNFS